MSKNKVVLLIRFERERERGISKKDEGSDSDLENYLHYPVQF